MFTARRGMFVASGLLLCVAMGLPQGRAAAGQTPQARQAPASPQPSGIAYRPWLGADGQPLPFRSDEEVLAFLRDATVVGEHDIPEGVTSPKKVLLEKDGLRVNAVFRAVNEDKSVMQFGTGDTELNFRDSYLFEPAAYQLATMLGLNNVPPAVLRKVKGQDGSVQIWVEQAMTEAKRLKTKQHAPDIDRWNRQYHTMNMFDVLVDNTDRNRGNILITPDWKMWYIDHTRAFRRYPDLRNPKKIVRCSRTMYERMKALDEPTLRQSLHPFLRNVEISAILKRRDKIIRRLDALIAEQGESAVLFDNETVSTGEHQ